MSAKKENKPVAPLWYIAILPPPLITREVMKFQEYARDQFNSSWALRSPPHITLFPPFRFLEKDFSRLNASLERFANKQSPFTLTLENFSCFEPRVIYTVVVLDSTLAAFQLSLKVSLKNELGLPYPGHHPFNPHMTVAFRDLDDEQFQRAWTYFSKQMFERQFQVTTISLLKHHKKGWRIFEEYALESKKPLLSEESRDH